EPKCPVCLWRPIENFASNGIVCKAPGVAQSLGFSQIGLAAPQSVFCLFPIIDISCSPVPTNDLTLRIPMWVVKEQEPAILPGSGEKPHLGLEGGAACDTILPGFPKPGQIVWMQVRTNVVIVQKLLQRQAPEIQRDLIGIEAASIRSQHHHLVRNSVHEL